MNIETIFLRSPITLGATEISLASAITRTLNVKTSVVLGEIALGSVFTQELMIKSVYGLGDSLGESI